MGELTKYIIGGNTKHIEEKQRDLNDTLRMAMDAYINARSFMHVGLYIYGPIIKVDKKIYPSIVPSIVNGAFACELFLKAMIIIKTNCLPSKQHNIFSLYKELDNPRIQEMLSEYSFLDEIKKISDAFEKWRYSHEYEILSVNRKFIFDLCGVLEKVNTEMIHEKYGFNINLN